MTIPIQQLRTEEIIVHMFHKDIVERKVYNILAVYHFKVNKGPKYEENVLILSRKQEHRFCTSKQKYSYMKLFYPHN